MKPEKKIVKRFDTLIENSKDILKSVILESQNGYLEIRGGNPEILDNRTISWKINSLNLLEKLFGVEGIHFKEFSKYSNQIQQREMMLCAVETLKAAKDDYIDGYIIRDTQKSNVKTSDVSDVNDKIEYLAKRCSVEAKRNTRIYLAFIFIVLLFISITFFCFFGIKYASFFTIGILIISYVLSAFSLKEWTPTKLPERLLEYEEDRTHKSFGVD